MNTTDRTKTRRAALATPAAAALLLALTLLSNSPARAQGGPATSNGRDRFLTGEVQLVADSLGNLHPARE